MVQNPDQMGRDATKAPEAPDAPLTRRQLVGAAAALGAAGLLTPLKAAAAPVPIAGTFQANRNQDEPTTRIERDGVPRA